MYSFVMFFSNYSSNSFHKYMRQLLCILDPFLLTDQNVHIDWWKKWLMFVYGMTSRAEESLMQLVFLLAKIS